VDGPPGRGSPEARYAKEIYDQHGYHVRGPLIMFIFYETHLLGHCRVESGVIYSAGILTYLVLGAISFTLPAQDPTTAMLAQLCGIVPTLLIVRVGLGASVQSAENTSVLDNDVYSPSRPHILGIRSDISRPYDVEKNIPCSDSYGNGKPQSF